MNVKVFGSTNCAGCVSVKRLLSERGVDYAEFDVNKLEHMEEAMANGVRSIPTLVIDEKTYVGANQCIEGIKQHLEV
jgi:glutaredoxin